jgi:hypothetical protein
MVNILIAGIIPSKDRTKGSGCFTVVNKICESVIKDPGKSRKHKTRRGYSTISSAIVKVRIS